VRGRLAIEEDESEMVRVMAGLLAVSGVFSTGRWSAVVGAGKEVVKRAKSKRKRSWQQSEIPLRGLGNLSIKPRHQSQAGAQSLFHPTAGCRAMGTAEELLLRSFDACLGALANSFLRSRGTRGHSDHHVR
jgi:hypothetical protein